MKIKNTRPRDESSLPERSDNYDAPDPAQFLDMISTWTAFDQTVRVCRPM